MDPDPENIRIPADPEGDRPADPPCNLPEELPAAMNLETIMDCTGEMEHLNELVMLSLEKEGGFTTTDAYLAVVQPIFDLLEVEIRVRYRPGMSRSQLKLIVQDWIDAEIRELQ